MVLDLRETYLLVPRAPRGTRDHARAEYTIRTLGLNRDVLVAARKAAYRDYAAHLRSYQSHRAAGAAESQLDELRLGVVRRQHPTVWREMLRQRERIPALGRLFGDLSDAASW
jgi:hypothetical protein